MRRLRYLPLPSLLVSSLVSTSVFAAPWVEDKAFFTEAANAPSSKVDAADLNGDGLIDLVFANGGGVDKGDDMSVEPQQAFINEGGTVMNDVSVSIFGAAPLTGRAVKLRDIDYDGDNDILLGTTWVTQSQLYLNDGGGSFSNVTDINLPKVLASIGDVEVGDVDYDGDLDVALANWGTAEGSVAQTSGGITLLWTQMGAPGFGEAGTGMFEDVTLGQMPSLPVRWSWDLEFVDVDNDYDLDVLVSAYAGDKASLFLFTNDGKGGFTDATAGNIPQGRYSLDVEPIDLNEDGFIDLLTLHDGLSGRNRLLINDKTGKFEDKTDLLWPKLANPASFDFMAAFYDHDSNGHPDMVIGALQTAQIKYPDRLVYEKAGKYESNTTAFTEVKPSVGTYALVLADFTGPGGMPDHRLDVAMAQNENAFDKKVLIATEEVPLDTIAPFLTNVEKLGAIQYPGNEVIRLRCNDNKSPLMLHDFKQTNDNEGFPYIETWDMEPADPDNMPGDISEPGQWYGEYLWRIQFAVPDADVMWYRLCAIDAANNKRCTPLEMTVVEGGTATESDSAQDTDMTDSITVTDSTDSQVSASEGTATNSTVSDSDTSATATITASEGTVSESETQASASASDSNTMGVPTEGSASDTKSTVSDSDTSATASQSDTVFETANGTDLDDDGCGCHADSSPAGGTLASLALLGLLGLRRRRK